MRQIFEISMLAGEELSHLSFSTKLIISFFMLTSFYYSIKNIIHLYKDLKNKPGKNQLRGYNNEVEQKFKKVPLMVDGYSGYSDQGIDPRELNPDYQDEDIGFK